MEMIDCLAPADLLVRGLNLSALPEAPVAVPPGTCSVVSGVPITAGYPVMDMVTDANAEFLDQFHGDIAGYVSEAEGRCYRNASPRKGNLPARQCIVFEDGTYFSPMVSRESARANNRPCWSEIVREVWPGRAGQIVLVMLTTDPKKRLWPRARVGALGNRTPVYYYDGGSSGAGGLLVGWAALLACLDVVEEVYTAGFPKAAIIESLYTAGKVTQTVGLVETAQMERRIAWWRGRAEFQVATLIAQKREEKDSDSAS